VQQLLLHREASSALADAYECSILPRVSYGRETVFFFGSNSTGEDKECKGALGVFCTPSMYEERRKKALGAMKRNLVLIYVIVWFNTSFRRVD